jgi:DNA-binding winged helix-turn-helix (wHTH) protein
MVIAVHEPTRELIKGNSRIRLQEQPFQIIQLLLGRPGALVTRDEIRNRLWPHGTFVDFEHSVNAAVKRLRAALGDDAKSPRYIETLPRRGYRWIHASSRAATQAIPPLDQAHHTIERIEIVWA